MSEDLAANLRNYQIQLQQVEAALSNEQDNEELIKLKHDLIEVITLTKQLMNNESVESAETSNVELNEVEVKHRFEPGDLCLAPWSEDGQFYEAQIEDVTSDGQCTVIFTNLGRKVSEVCLVALLKPLGKKKTHKPTAHPKNSKMDLGKVKRQLQQEQREYLKKKQQKKKERLKELEEEREKEKTKWQQFHNKAFNKHLKGAVKKSIFASPDNVSGKVGVGTCGVGGQPMTEFTQAEKWKRSSGLSSSSSSHSRYSHSHRYK